MANTHVWLISQAEAQILAGIIGRRLERIRFDGASASLEFDSCALVACPEIGTGSSRVHPNKEEIMRLSVRPVTAEGCARLDNASLRQLALGKHVRDIHILHSLVVFSEAVEVGPQRMGPIQLPAGLGYDAESVVWATREKMRQVQMIGMRMGLQAMLYVIQRTTTVQVRRGHKVGSQINQQIVVNQCGGPFPQTWPPESSCLDAISTFAKILREGIRRCGS